MCTHNSGGIQNILLPVLWAWRGGRRMVWRGGRGVVGVAWLNFGRFKRKLKRLILFCLADPST